MEKSTTVYRWGEARSSALNVTCSLCNPSPCQGKLFLQDDALAPLQVTGELPYAHGLHTPHKWLLRKSCPSYHSYNQWLYIYYYIKCVPLDISSMNTRIPLLQLLCKSHGSWGQRQDAKAWSQSRVQRQRWQQNWEASWTCSHSIMNKQLICRRKNVHILKKLVTWGTRELVW